MYIFLLSSLIITECRINSYSLLFSCSLRLLVAQAINPWNGATNYGQYRSHFPRHVNSQSLLKVARL